MAMRTTSRRESAIPPQAPDAVPNEPVTGVDLDAAGSGTGPAGSAGDAPSGGPTSSSPESTPAPDPGDGGPESGGTTGEGGGGGVPADMDKFASEAAKAFFELLRTSASPEAQEAESIILRRLALQGDIIPSRVPPPLNITEIGGYLNMLTNLDELEMRSRVLAGILGVAGPSQPLSHIGTGTALSFTPVVNDRPEGPFQPRLPVTVLVRSDFAGLLRAAIDTLHAQGALLPMLGGPYALPPAGGPMGAVVDPLDYIGRTVRLADTAALHDPTSDPLALVREAGSTGPFRLAARSDGTGDVEITASDYEALQSAGGAISAVPVNAARFVVLEDALAPTGFIPGGTVVNTPSDAEPRDWARWRNLSGLEVGMTLGGELRLLRSQTEIAASALAPMVNWAWNGTEFAP